MTAPKSPKRKKFDPQTPPTPIPPIECGPSVDELSTRDLRKLAEYFDVTPPDPFATRPVLLERLTALEDNLRRFDCPDAQLAEALQNIHHAARSARALPQYDSDIAPAPYSVIRGADGGYDIMLDGETIHRHVEYSTAGAFARANARFKESEQPAPPASIPPIQPPAPQLNPGDTFTHGAARYAKGMIAVCPGSDGSGFKGRAARIATKIGGRWTHRDGAYLMSPTKFEKFKLLLAEGDTSNAPAPIQPPAPEERHPEYARQFRIYQEAKTRMQKEAGAGTDEQLREVIQDAAKGKQDIRSRMRREIAEQELASRGKTESALFDADAAGASRPGSGLFGQTIFDPATGNVQHWLFDTAKPEPISPPIKGSRSALDPRNTVKLFTGKQTDAESPRRPAA